MDRKMDIYMDGCPLWDYLSVCLDIRLSVCLSVRLSVCLSVRLFLCLSVWLTDTSHVSGYLWLGLTIEGAVSTH